jgi:response regulator RpfG family c-di-GMP phosphodiesterase
MTGDAGEAARIEWEYATEVNRDKELVQSLALALSLTETQLDELFTAAAAL